MADGERKDGFTLIKFTDSSLSVTHKLPYDKICGWGGYTSTGLDTTTSGGPLRINNRNIPEGGIRPTLNIKNLGFPKG